MLARMRYTMSKSLISEDTIYEISNWEQIIGMRSKIYRHLRVAVCDYVSAYIIAKVIKIYLDDTDMVLDAFMVSGNSEGLIDATPHIISRDEALERLNSFGFPLQWIEEPIVSLTENTKSFLRAAMQMGYEHIKRTSSETELFITVPNGVPVNVIQFPLAAGCDFSALDVEHYYSIQNLLDANDRGQF